MMEDYVKWKPSLFRAFAAKLVDEEASIAGAAHSALFHALLPRSPLLNYNSFIGILFQLNGYICEYTSPETTPELTP